MMMIPPAPPTAHTVSWPAGSPVQHSSGSPPTESSGAMVSWANLSPLPCTTSPTYCNGMVSPSVVWPTPTSPDLQSSSRVSPQSSYHPHHHHFMQPMMEFAPPHHHAHLHHHHAMMAPPPLIAMPEYQPASPHTMVAARPHSQSPPHHPFENLAKSEVLSEPYSEDESNSRNDWSPLTPPTGL